MNASETGWLLDRRKILCKPRCRGFLVLEAPSGELKAFACDKCFSPGMLRPLDEDLAQLPEVQHALKNKEHRRHQKEHVTRSRVDVCEFCRRR